MSGFTHASTKNARPHKVADSDRVQPRDLQAQPLHADGVRTALRRPAARLPRRPPRALQIGPAPSLPTKAKTHRLAVATVEIPFVSLENPAKLRHAAGVAEHAAFNDLDFGPIASPARCKSEVA